MVWFDKREGRRKGVCVSVVGRQTGNTLGKNNKNKREREETEGKSTKAKKKKKKKAGCVCWCAGGSEIRLGRENSPVHT